MKDLYFARHGQTEWNVENKICGASESPLTELGRQQAVTLAQNIIESKVQIDEILYSPLSRAADTAKFVSKLTGIPAIKEERLREQNFGIWEGTPRHSEGFTAAKSNFIDSYGSGESMLKVAARIYSLLDEIKNDDSGTIYLLVAHNGIARMVQSYFYDMTNDEFAHFGIKNCELVRYCFT